MATILAPNGPNLNLPGMRQPEIHGTDTLADIETRLRRDPVDFILFNPAAFTHTSVALRDALLGTGIPFVELHLSNVHGREEFRRRSCFSDIACGVVAGFGAQSHELALQGALRQPGAPAQHQQPF